MRFMHVGSESIAIIIAVGFVVLEVVGIPIAKWFLLGAVVLGIAAALLLRFSAKG